MIEPIVLSILPYALIALAMGACLYLFLTLKREIFASEQRHKRRSDALEEHLAACKVRLAELSAELRAASRYLPGPPPGPRTLDLPSRTQALRMVERGEAPAAIASALGLPRNQIELFVKVQKGAAARDAKITS
jgi:hypothetical protein